jgi:hypothetical protein
LSFLLFSAFQAADTTNTSKSKMNPVLGRLGGLKGGAALAAKMTPTQRKAVLLQGKESL